MKRKKTILLKINDLLEESNKKYKYQPIINNVNTVLNKKTFIHTKYELGIDTIDNINLNLSKIDNEYLERSPVQIKFHHLLTVALLPFIFGVALEYYLKQIQEYIGFNKITRGVVFPAMRQAGKTESMLIYSAVVFFCVRLMNITVLANGKEVLSNDKGFLFRIKPILAILGLKKFKVNNDKHLNAEFPDTRTISCFSAEQGDS